MQELLRPLEASAWRCGMHWQSPFVVHSARSLSDQTLADAAKRYQVWLSELMALPPVSTPQESHT
jgi:glutathione-regulated potassium-efflux system ancillary protein KefG